MPPPVFAHSPRRSIRYVRKSMRRAADHLALDSLYLNSLEFVVLLS
jgi:hypothetical protein